MNYLITNGVGEMIGVMYKKSLFYRQVQLATIFQGYRPMYVSSIEEAEIQLANCRQRNGLRFNLQQKTVHYMTCTTEGTGYILNISTSGCAVNQTSTHPFIDEEIQITIVFTTQDQLQKTFTGKARIVRIEDDSFAAQFTDLDTTREEQLWKYIVDESQRAIS